LNVFKGDTNDNFNPKDNISRAEAAAVIYRIATQDVKDTQIEMYATSDYFDDVTPTDWFAGYVNYCANATYIKGTGERNFEPYGEVTGYQVLAMILRAAGYDANGEFTGEDWQIKVASTAKELKIIDTVSDVRLDQPVTREVVAELLFQTLENVQKVRYTNAFGYIPYGDVLGTALFGLTTRSTTDAWGRPGTEWYATKPGTKEYTVVTYNDTPVYTATVRVDECDIAKEVGFNAPATIESAWIDGDNSYKVTNSAVTTDQDGKIDPLKTTSYVGAQGRQLEVYDMGAAGYRLVEINTYLAQVTKVTAATTDKNGHVVPAYATLTVQADANSAGSLQAVTANVNYTTDSLAKGDYVLTTYHATKGIIEAPTVTTSVASGALTAFTLNTTKVGTADAYNDADKFVLNNSKSLANINTVYDVFVDQYGNIIGLTESTKNYLVIEGIRWIHDGTLYGGYALANVVLANGTRVEGIKIAQVGSNPTNDTGDSLGAVAAGKVSDYYTNNTEYYKHLYTYTVNADGTYSLGVASAHNFTGTNDCVCSANDATSATITTGLTTIQSNTNTVVANDNTVFLVLNAATGTYTTYVGKNNVPTMTGANICYLTNAAGYATVVVVSSYTAATNTFIAYVPAETAATLVGTNMTALGVTGNVYAYNVYKLGETTPTVVYSSNADAFAGAVGAGSTKNNGFYSFTVNDRNVIQIATATPVVMVMSSTSNSVKNYGPALGSTFDRAFVKSDLTGNSLILSSKDGSTTVGDYYVDNAQYIKVNTVTLPSGSTVTEVTAASAADLVAGTKVIVTYKSDNTAGAHVVDYVYIIATENQSVTTPGVVTYGVVLDANKNLVVTRYVDGVATADGTNATNFSYATYTSAGVLFAGGSGTDNISATSKTKTVNLSSTLTAGNTYYVAVTINGVTYNTNSLTV
jgi:hypothetical protein